MAAFTFGPYRLDAAAGRLSRDNADVRLRPQALQVLRVLLQHLGRPIGYDQMIAEAWHGTFVSRHTVDVTVGEVKKVLGEYGRWIVHRPKVGYSLEVPTSDELVRKGWHFASRRTKEGAERAIECFQQAAVQCPGDFRAFEGLSTCYLMQATFGICSPTEVYPRFLDAHTQAVAQGGLTPELRCNRAHGLHMDRHPRVQIALYSVSIAGPFEPGTLTETPSRRRLFVCRPASAAKEDDCAKRIVSTVARRAFRRAVTDADIEAPMRFYKEARAAGDFDDGVEMALRAVLASTEFLFRIERDPRTVKPQTPYRISDVELASRLSFFLWSSVPDEELLDAAIAGTLSRPATLERQVKRMLASPKAEALVTNFAGQWLYLRNLAAANPDARTFPDFDDNLRQAFKRETELFVESVVQEDRSALDLLRANYTFVNERLARHYGIPNVYGSRFRRVTLGDDSNRGGILGQGSILTVTSYANRTSPVLRGKWILENIVGTPPPPPPPNVPPLKDTDTNGRLLSMRERMTRPRIIPPLEGGGSATACSDELDGGGLFLVTAAFCASLRSLIAAEMTTGV